LNTFYDYLHYYQNALQTPSPNTGFTMRLYRVHAARPQRAHGALEDTTALPQHPHSALYNTSKGQGHGDIEHKILVRSIT